MNYMIKTINENITFRHATHMKQIRTSQLKVPSRQKVSVNAHRGRTMASLSQRLKKMQVSDDSQLPSIDHLKLEDLESMKVSFGQKHSGSTFSEVWKKDQDWVSFVVNHYATSRKESHRLFIRYVELKLEWHEANMVSIPKVSPIESQGNQQMPVFTRLGAKSKAAPKAAADHSTGAGVITHLPDMEPEEWEISSQMYHPGSMNQSPVDQDPSFLEMRERLLNMENVMNRVIQHLEQAHQPSGETNAP